MKKNLYWMAAAFITLTAVGCTNAKKADVSAGRQRYHTSGRLAYCRKPLSITMEFTKVRFRLPIVRA